MSKKQKGFSLIELLIVVAIILIIAAIAIPNLIRSRLAANEASAVGSIRTIVTANVTYDSTYGNGFAPSLAVLGGTGAATCNNSEQIDTVLAAGQKSGYNFTYTAGTADATAPTGCTTPGSQTFAIAGQPVVIGTTGQRSFCSDESGVIRFDPTGATVATSDTACQALTPLQ